jgi:hypothetical protein
MSGVLTGLLQGPVIPPAVHGHDTMSLNTPPACFGLKTIGGSKQNDGGSTSVDNSDL